MPTTFPRLIAIVAVAFSLIYTAFSLALTSKTIAERPATPNGIKISGTIWLDDGSSIVCENGTLKTNGTWTHESIAVRSVYIHQAIGMIGVTGTVLCGMLLWHFGGPERQPPETKSVIGWVVATAIMMNIGMFAILYVAKFAS